MNEFNKTFNPINPRIFRALLLQGIASLTPPAPG